jgi:cell shape-determining protein MreC
MSALILGIILIVVVIMNFLFPNLMSPVMHVVGVPVMYTNQFLTYSFGDAFTLLHSKQNLIQKNRELREKLELFNAVEVEKASLLAENMSLRNVVDNKKATPGTILAQIISKPGFSPYDTVVLDVGEKEGVKPGDLLLADQAVILGEIATVYAHSANALLYSSAEHKTDVFIGSTTLETTATGKGGGNFEIRLPRNADIKEGDIVTFAKSPNKVFGKVTAINVASADTFERILFRSAVDVSKLRFVTIEKQP